MQMVTTTVIAKQNRVQEWNDGETAVQLAGRRRLRSTIKTAKLIGKTSGESRIPLHTRTLTV